MIRVACWTCALLALASAHIYSRCELALELRALGVVSDHISTWVCIAYHESRFDTSANNPYSGDHGLFQISELYWCGPGKACGLPCSALRDEDISDDLECALRVHEEHTRLQGDGFLAWVVYPQHCKHNTKKYIVDCDSHLKEGTVRSRMRSRTLNSNVRNRNAIFEYNPNIDSLNPPYLTINSITRGSFSKVLETGKRTSAPFNWLNFKIDNIDELTLPVFGGKSKPFTTPTTTTTSAPITTYSTYAPIKVWRRIESNQFRKKSVMDEKKTTNSKWSELGKSTSSYFASPTLKNGAIYNDRIHTTPKATTVNKRPTEATTIIKPKTEAIITAKPTAEKSTVAKLTTDARLSAIPFSPTARIQTTTSTPLLFTTSTKHTTVKVTTESPAITTAPYKPFTYFTFTTGKPTTLTLTSQKRPTQFTTKEPIYKQIQTSPSSTNKPIYESTTTKGLVTTTTPVTFTSRTFTFRPKTSQIGIRETTGPTTFRQISFPPTLKNRFGLNQKSFTTVPTSTSTTTEMPAFKSFRTSRLLTQNFTGTSTSYPFSNSRPHSTSRPLATRRPFSTSRPFTTSRPFSTSRPFTTVRPFTTSTQFTTSFPFSSNRLISTASSSSLTPFYTKSATTQRPVPNSAFTTKSASTTKSWQSIFDLYLKPTQRPTFRTLFPELSKSAFRLKIFSGGTTTPVPLSPGRHNQSTALTS